MRDYSSHSEKWSEAEVVRLGPVTYWLLTPSNKVVKRHMDQLRPTGRKPLQGEVREIDNRGIVMNVSSAAQDHQLRH